MTSEVDATVPDSDVVEEESPGTATVFKLRTLNWPKKSQKSLDGS